MTLLLQHPADGGLIKLTGVITRSLACRGSESRMEQRCDGEGQEAIVPQCARWILPVTPCRSRFKDWGEAIDSDGWRSAGDAHGADVPPCLCLAVQVSEEQFVLLTFNGSGWEGHCSFLVKSFDSAWDKLGGWIHNIINIKINRYHQYVMWALSPTC